MVVGAIGAMGNGEGMLMHCRLPGMWGAVWGNSRQPIFKETGASPAWQAIWARRQSDGTLQFHVSHSFQATRMFAWPCTEGPALMSLTPTTDPYRTVFACPLQVHYCPYSR